MHLTVDGKDYRFVRNAMTDSKWREQYCTLAKTVFGLDFSPWYNSGYYDGSFVPYTLYDGHTAAASVGVVPSNFNWNNSKKIYAQISTVMTHPDYRGRGLSDALLKLVLAEWESKCDMIYLYANDSVTRFYPRYGFVEAKEHLYSKPIAKREGQYRKLDLQNPTDAALLTEKYMAVGNPFSALQMDRNLSHLMFHCVTFLQDSIYYVEAYDAVVIAEYEDDHIFCYDIFTDKKCETDEILGILATGSTVSAQFGFTPKETKGFSVEESAECDTTVFVYKMTDSLFHTHKVTFPFLSRA